MAQKHPMQTKGFTLLELSIVLVVIGLIAGGIMVGKEMITNAEMNSIVTEHQRYQVAVANFMEKYSGLPGDLPNANKYWASETNGNGDGLIQWAESDHAWRQLTQAGILNGKYTGTGDIATSENDSPASRITGVGWSFNVEGGNATTWFDTLDYKQKTLLMVGRFASYYTAEPFLTPQRAMLIDAKMDDGLPYRGKVIGPMRDWQPNCATGTSGNLSYNVTLDTEVCFLNILLSI